MARGKRPGGCSAVEALEARTFLDASAFEPARLTAFNNALYFIQYSGGHGTELWTSDGTPAGTHLVRDIAPGPASGMDGLVPLTAYRGRLYFRATDDAHGSELWASDGTAEGTVLVKDILPGPDGSTPQEIGLTRGGQLLFYAAGGTYTTDGTDAGTVPVGPGFQWYGVGQDTAGFSAGSTPETGAELFHDEGSGPTLVADIEPGPAASYPQDLTAVDGKLFFTAYRSGLGRQLYVFDAGEARLLDAVSPWADGAIWYLDPHQRTLVVLYHDNAKLDVPALAGNDAAVRVTGPNGFDVLARYTGEMPIDVTHPPPGSYFQAGYAFDPPGGEWDASENGTYTIRLEPGVLKDTTGNAAPAATIGTFTVDRPASGPDLAVALTARAPAGLFGGRKNPVTLLVKNVGDRPARGTWPVRLTLDPLAPSPLASGDIRVKADVLTGELKINLRPGATRRFVLHPQIPTFLSLGDYVLRATLEKNYQAPELHLINNEAAGPTLQLTQPLLDLSATVEVPPGGLQAGQPSQVVVNLASRASALPPRWKIGFTVSAWLSKGSSGTQWSLDLFLGRLLPGTRQRIVLTDPAPYNLEPGTYDLTVHVWATLPEPLGSLRDPDNSNDVVTAVTTLQDPPRPLDPSPARGGGAQGRPVRRA